MPYYSVKPIHLSLHPSRQLAWIIGLASLLGCIILLLFPIHLAIRIPVILLIIVSAVHSVRRHALIASAQSITHVSLNHESKLQLTLKDGTKLEVKVLDSSFIAAYLTVLNMQVLNIQNVDIQSPEKKGLKLRNLQTGSKINLILLPENVDADSFRQLRVWLRWGREKPEEMTNLA